MSQEVTIAKFMIWVYIFLQLSASHPQFSQEDLSFQYYKLVKDEKTGVFCEIVVHRGDHKIRTLSRPFEKGTVIRKNELDMLLLYNKSMKQARFQDRTLMSQYVRKLGKRLKVARTNMHKNSVLRDVNYRVWKVQSMKMEKDKLKAEEKRKQKAKLKAENKAISGVEKKNETPKDENPAVNTNEMETRKEGEKRLEGGQDAKPLLGANAPKGNEAIKGDSSPSADKPSEQIGSVHTIYMRCRLPVAKDTATIRASGKCREDKQALTVKYKTADKNVPEIINHPFVDTEAKYTRYFLDEMSYSDKNAIKFDPTSCVLEISAAAVHGFGLLMVLFSYFI